jgi:transglutaminase-like putative cysteine protease
MVATLHNLSAAIREKVDYQTGATNVDTSAEEAVAAGQGVCQDHAHIFIAAARALDIPARYVSGYLMMNDRIEQEATHAWAEAYVQNLGWVGFDISNQISPDPRYVRLATGRDYRDAAPITGISFGAATEDLTVNLAVEQQTVEQQQQ